MRIITEEPLKDYIARFPDTKTALQNWVKIVKEAQWNTFSAPNFLLTFVCELYRHPQMHTKVCVELCDDSLPLSMGKLPIKPPYCDICHSFCRLYCVNLRLNINLYEKKK